MFLEKCIHCKVPVVEGETVLERTIAGRDFELSVPCAVCPECDEEYIDAAEVQRFELHAARQLALHGPFEGEALRYMRKALGLPGAELAGLLGVTPESVSRWEHDKLSFDRRTFALVGLMVLDRVEGRSTVTDVLRGLGQDRAA